MEANTTLRDAILYFADFENCRKFMVELRWPDGVVKCPTCGATKLTWLAKSRVWKCYAKHPKPTFSLKTGTIFEDSPIALEKWLPAAWLIINCKNGVSSYEVHRDLGVTQKSAWFMLHRIRLAMQSGTINKMFGEIEADESFVGGKMANMTKARQEKLKADGRKRGAMAGKAVVAGLLERHTGKARVKVMPNVRGYHIRTNIIDNVVKGSTIYSDALHSYRNVTVDGYFHEFIDHTEAYVNGRCHTNSLENFWSLLKRALKGTYVSVEPYHLQAYCDEQLFRFNERKATDAERFAMVMKQIVGRRITYKQLIGAEPSDSSSTDRA